MRVIYRIVLHTYAMIALYTYILRRVVVNDRRDEICIVRVWTEKSDGNPRNSRAFSNATVFSAAHLCPDRSINLSLQNRVRIESSQGLLVYFFITVSICVSLASLLLHCECSRISGNFKVLNIWKNDRKMLRKAEQISGKFKENARVKYRNMIFILFNILL